MNWQKWRRNCKITIYVCLTNCNSLIADDLWQAHYQFLLIILLKEFIKLNANTDTIIKNTINNCNFCKYTNVKDDLVLYKCFCCNRNYQKRIDEKLKKWFTNTYKCFKHYINNFILLLQKGVYLYVNIDDWKKFNET